MLALPYLMINDLLNESPIALFKEKRENHHHHHHLDDLLGFLLLRVESRRQSRTILVRCQKTLT